VANTLQPPTNDASASPKVTALRNLPRSARFRRHMTIDLREYHGHEWGGGRRTMRRCPPQALSRPVSVCGFDELQQCGGRTAVLLLDLLRVLSLHAIERVSEALVTAVELLE
jgi:hypothetical protein